MSIVLAVGTSTGLLVLSGNADPGSWKTMGQSLTGKSVTCLSSNQAGHLYVGTKGYGVYRTTTLEDWTAFTAGLSTAQVTALECDPLHPDRIFCAASPGQFHVSCRQGADFEVRRSLRALPSADKWSNPVPPYQPIIRRIYAHPGRPDLVLVAVQSGGIYLTADGGQNWQDKSKGLPADVRDFRIHPAQPGRVYAATRVGLFRSDDLGVSWTGLNDGLTSLDCEVVCVSVEEPEAVFCISHRSASGGGYVFRSPNGGQKWKLCPGQLPFSPELRYTTMVSGRGWLFLGTASGDLYGSTDFGHSWQLYRTKISPIQSLHIVYQS